MRCLLLVAIVFASRADADEVKPLRVTSRLDGPTADFDVRFAVKARAGASRDLAEVVVPDSGIVAGGRVVIDGATHVLDLGEATPLDEGFTTLAGAPRDGEPATAVVVHRKSGAVSIDVAVPQATTIELQLHVTTTTCLFHDRRYASVPASWKLGRRDDDVTLACGAISDSSMWLPFATTELERAPDRVGVIGGQLATRANHFARVEVDLAARLADTPPDLATALVIDSSRSLTPAQVDIQREVVLAYLRAVPRSRVQVIATARTATAMLPGWMPASSVLPRLDRELRNLSLKNGSNADAGIAEAERWLARVPGTHRIIVFTDERLPQRLLDTPPSSHELTHVVELDERRSGLERVDDGPLVTLASSTTGIAVRGGRQDRAEAIDATILVRPIALDNLEIEGDGWTAVTGLGDCNTVLASGHACTWWGEGSAVARPIVVDGLLWNRKVSRIVQLDPRQATAVARELAITNVLDEPIMRDVERAAHAVTEHWSLDARWGGTAGYAQIEGIGIGSIGTVSHDRGTSRIIDKIGIANVPIVIDLRPQLEHAIEGCHAAHHRIVIDLETTREEIVDVTATVSPKLIDPEPAVALDAIRSCVVEAVWQVTLALPSHLEHRVFHVGLGP